MTARRAAPVLVAMMFAGSLVAWVGVPVAWLWVGSRIVENHSMSTAIAAMMAGMVASEGVVLALLGRLGRLHTEIEERTGIPERETTTLELVLVASAVVAVAAFFVWFFGFSGSSPIPLNIGY